VKIPGAMHLKLVIAVVQERDWQALREALIEKNYRVTRLSSSGGFLRQGNTTLLIGVTESQVDDVIATVREQCQSRQEFVSSYTSDHMIDMPVGVKVGGATVFVLEVDQYERI
jgi:uncharacterized protein YaaQ